MKLRRFQSLVGTLKTLDVMIGLLFSPGFNPCRYASKRTSPTVRLTSCGPVSIPCRYAKTRAGKAASTQAGFNPL